MKGLLVKKTEKTENLGQKYSNSDFVASEDKFVGLGIKKRPAARADGIGALFFMEELNDLIE